MDVNEFKKERRPIVITLRTSERIKKFIDENEINPSKFFNTKIKELIVK